MAGLNAIAAKRLWYKFIGIKFHQRRIFNDWFDELLGCYSRRSSRNTSGYNNCGGLNSDRKTSPIWREGGWQVEYLWKKFGRKVELIRSEGGGEHSRFESHNHVYRLFRHSLNLYLATLGKSIKPFRPLYAFGNFAFTFVLICTLLEKAVELFKNGGIKS